VKNSVTYLALLVTILHQESEPLRIRILARKSLVQTNRQSQYVSSPIGKYMVLPPAGCFRSSMATRVAALPSLICQILKVNPFLVWLVLTLASLQSMSFGYRVTYMLLQVYRVCL
jgi:hypothetical protein